MKSCPSCNRTYEDETMVFCLNDGSRLLATPARPLPETTLVLPTPRATELGPTVASQQPTSQPTILATPELVRLKTSSYDSVPSGSGSPDRSRASALPWLLGIAIVLGLSGIVIAVILTRGSGGANQPTAQSPARAGVVPQPERSPTLDPIETPEPTPTTTEETSKNTLPKASPPERPKPAFAVMDNTSLNGSRITYYPSPSFRACQSDCAANANCKGLAWIRPEAYNPGDAAMCYLLSEVSGKVTHTCCIAAVRNQ